MVVFLKAYKEVPVTVPDHKVLQLFPYLLNIFKISLST